MAGDPRSPGQPEASAAADAANGIGGRLSAAEHEQAGARERGLPVSARRAVDSAGQPGPTRSAPTFVSRPWRRPWHSTASLKSSTRRLPVHQHRVHRRARSIRHHDQHGWEGALHGQHLRRTTVAKPEIRGGLNSRFVEPAIAEPTPKSAGLHLNTRLRLSHTRGPPPSSSADGHRLTEM
jgi:hypothetical protein